MQNIEIKRTGFPIQIGGIDFFFSTAEDNIARFLEMVNDPESYAKKVDELADEATLIEVKDGEIPDVEQYRKMIELQKRALEIIYDVMLGEGGFKLLYAIYPDVRALINIMNAVIETISTGLEEWRKAETKKAQKQIGETIIAKKKKTAKKAKK
ncbi:UNVERIFIED_CONTAM: hypothetical protein RF648_20935 [Kocuria sp. CPCC 205274]